MRGRKPTPARLRLLAEDRERVIGSTTPPECPNWLSDEAREEWQRVVSELANGYVLTQLDQTTLAAYCETYAQWRKAVKEVRQEGFTVATKEGIKAHPTAKICSSLVCELRRMAAEFGFSPAARSRIDIPKPEGQEESELESFLGESDVGRSAAPDTQ
jgi:P27 family predicted phage terminase small subunit